MNIIIRVAIIVLTIMVGLAVGSFLNVVIYRLPNNMSLSKPASHCPKCNHKIKWYDNIPVLSYIILRGKCRYCKEKISFRYPAIELINMTLWFICLICFTNVIVPTMAVNWIKFGTSLITCSALICIFCIDLDHMVIPDVLQGVFLVAALVLLLDKPDFKHILLKLIGFGAMFLLFYIVNTCYKLIKHRDGIGFGDVILASLGGLYLGIYEMLYGLLIACISGAIILILIGLIKKEKGREYPFATFLTGGILIAMFTGEYVINWYSKLLGGF